MKKEEQENENEKTENPTEHKKNKFKERGDFPISREFGNLIILLSCYFISTQIVRYSKSGMHLFSFCMHNIDNSGIVKNVFSQVFIGLAMMLAGIGAVLFIIHTSQTQFTFSAKKLEWNFKKINPLKSFKNLFGTQMIINLLKTVAKFCLLIIAVFWVSKDTIKYYLSGTHVEIPTFWHHLSIILNPILGTICLYFICIGCFDYGFQFYKHMKKLKMDKKEILDEQKENEGDPSVRNRQKSIRKQMMSKLLEKEVPNSSLVVTNPEHFAVAIKWENNMFAPIVVAKGTDLMAQRIKDLARRYNVPVVRQPQLARSLYYEVKIGQNIKKSHYRPVAEVIHYIKKTKMLMG